MTMKNGDLAPGQQYVVIRPRDDVIRQAKTAHADLISAGWHDGQTLRDAADINHAAFARLVEAMFMLGMPVSDEIGQLAGLRPVDEIIT